LIGSVFFFIGQAFASDYMTLEDSIKEAIQNNPSIKAQDQEVMSKDLDQRSSFGRLLPTVTLSYGYARLNQEPTMTTPAQRASWMPVVNGQGTEPTGGETAYAYVPASLGSDIPIGTRDNYAFTIEATQPLFTGGTLYNSYRIAKNNYLAADLDRQSVIRDLKRQIIEAYYGVIEARQVYEVAQSGLSSIKAHLDVANAFYNQGMIPKNDLLEAQVRYAQSEQNLIIAENAIKLSESGVNLLLGRSLGEPVVIDTEIPMAEMVETLDLSTETALKIRQEIKTLMIQIDNANKAITISRAGYLPSLAATGTYERTGDHPDVEDDSWSIGVGMSWNLFKGGSDYYDISKAKSLSSKLGYLLTNLENQISLEVKNAYLSASEARARTAVAEKAIDQAEENLRIQKDRYNLQVATTTEVLDAQAMLDQAMKNYISARASYAKGLASLHAAMGTL
ncbi:MAG: TolC family protein, partial [Deltaproteobacteria bacterium]|nr:TolC family protein [Deltaproteobacteria bacterium]